MKKRKIKEGFLLTVFFMYLLVLLSLVFGVDRMESSEYHYNLVLFDEIRRYFKYRDIVGNRIFLMNIAGNFVGFMPFGFFVPALSKKNKRNWLFVTLLSLELSLFIEMIQLYTRVGSFDVDDLLLNTLGGSTGCFFYMMLTRFWRKKE